MDVKQQIHYSLNAVRGAYRLLTPRAQTHSLQLRKASLCEVEQFAQDPYGSKDCGFYNTPVALEINPSLNCVRAETHRQRENQEC